jgi:hypothetical protein
MHKKCIKQIKHKTGTEFKAATWKINSCRQIWLQHAKRTEKEPELR